MKFLSILLILFVHTDALNLPSTVREAVKFSNMLPEESYNTLVNEIQENKISDIAFTTTFDKVISQHIDAGTNEFAITKINPFVIDTITDRAIAHNVHTVFLDNAQQGVSNLATEVLGFVGNNLFPWLFFFFFLNSLRNGPPGGGPSGMGLPGLRKSINDDKIAMQKANVSLSSFAGSEEIKPKAMRKVPHFCFDRLFANET